MDGLAVLGAAADDLSRYIIPSLRVDYGDARSRFLAVLAKPDFERAKRIVDGLPDFVSASLFNLAGNMDTRAIAKYLESHLGPSFRRELDEDERNRAYGAGISLGLSPQIIQLIFESVFAKPFSALNVYYALKYVPGIVNPDASAIEAPVSIAPIEAHPAVLGDTCITGNAHPKVVREAIALRQGDALTSAETVSLHMPLLPLVCDSLRYRPDTEITGDFKPGDEYQVDVAPITRADIAASFSTPPFPNRPRRDDVQPYSVLEKLVEKFPNALFWLNLVDFDFNIKAGVLTIARKPCSKPYMGCSVFKWAARGVFPAFPGGKPEAVLAACLYLCHNFRMVVSEGVVWIHYVGHVDFPTLARPVVLCVGLGRDSFDMMRVAEKYLSVPEYRSYGYQLSIGGCARHVTPPSKHCPLGSVFIRCRGLSIGAAAGVLPVSICSDCSAYYLGASRLVNDYGREGASTISALNALPRSLAIYIDWSNAKRGANNTLPYPVVRTADYPFSYSPWQLSITLRAKYDGGKIFFTNEPVSVKDEWQLFLSMFFSDVVVRSISPKLEFSYKGFVKAIDYDHICITLGECLWHVVDAEETIVRRRIT